MSQGGKGGQGESCSEGARSKEWAEEGEVLVPSSDPEIQALARKSSHLGLIWT